MMSTRTFKSGLSGLVRDIENAGRVLPEHAERMHELAFEYAGTDYPISKDLLTIWKSSRCANMDLVTLSLNLLNCTL